jgi:cytoskeletal protein CcmA (bactofilin family)
MEKKDGESIKKNEKRAIISSTGSLKEFEEHVSISGTAKISGGKINKSIRVSGSGKINGDLECNGLTSSGSLKGSGNLSVHGDVSSAGSFNIAGHLYGDESADFSGSTQIGNLVNVQGTLIASGSFKAGHFVRGEQGVILSGSSTINGNLSSEKKVDIDGTTYIEGNVVAEEIFLGPSENKKRKQHYRIHGSVLAKNIVNVVKTHVEGDVKARDVTIGKGSEVLGTIYYVDNVDIDKKVKISNEPIQIKIEEL